MKKTWKITRKSEYQKYVFKIATAMWIALLSVFCALGVFTYYSLVYHPMTFTDYSRSLFYNMAADWEIENSDFVGGVIEFCKPFEGEDQVECVVENIGVRYEYVDREVEDYSQVVKFVDDLGSGYLCRDVHLAYVATFKALGYWTDSIFAMWKEGNETKSHVYTHVVDFNTGRDCTINMDRWYCW